MPVFFRAGRLFDCYGLETAGYEAQEEPLAKKEFIQGHYKSLDQGCADLQHGAFEVEPLIIDDDLMERFNPFAENERYSRGYHKVDDLFLSWDIDSIPGVLKCTTPFDDLSLGDMFGKEGTRKEGKECTHFDIRRYRGYSVYPVPYDRHLPMLVMGKDDVSDSESDRDSISNSIGSLRSEDAPICFGCGHNEHICNHTNHIYNHIEHDSNYCIDEAISKLKMEREECLRNIELWEKALRFID